jgi:hypothetical protein
MNPHILLNNLLISHIQKMMKVQMLKDLLTHKSPLLLITIVLTFSLLSHLHQQSLVSVFFSGNSAAFIPELAFLKSALTAHGQEIALALHNSSFGPLTSGGGNQVSVFASYEVNDDSIIGQTINAVMDVYAPNGTLIKTSSYPNGFIAQSSGGVEGLETTIRDPTINSVTANVTFRNLDKTEILSDDLRVDLSIAGEGTASMTATGEGAGLDKESPGPESESEQALGPGQTGDEETSGLEDGEEDEDTEDEEQNEGRELPLPLFG